MQNYLEHNANGPTWSLAVEEHFYLLLPGLLLLLSRSATPAQFERRVLTAGLVVMFVVLVARCYHTWQSGVHSEDYRLSHYRIDSLLLGVLVQLMARREHGLARTIASHPWWALAAASVLIAPSLVMGRSHPVMFSIGFTGLGLGYALILLVFSQGFDFRHPGLLGRILARIGTWSYNIYLWNFFLAALPLGAYALAQGWLASSLSDSSVGGARPGRTLHRSLHRRRGRLHLVGREPIPLAARCSATREPPHHKPHPPGASRRNCQWVKLCGRAQFYPEPAPDIFVSVWSASHDRALREGDGTSVQPHSFTKTMPGIFNLPLFPRWLSLSHENIANLCSRVPWRA